MIRFGPAGNSDSFYAQGYKRTQEAPKWLRTMGLTAFEYSFGRGVTLSQQTGAAIADEAEKYGVALSAHAVYFINLAVTDGERVAKNVDYFLQCARGVRYLRGDRLIFHPGAVQGGDRRQALSDAAALLGRIIGELDEAGYGDIALCPETMGKISQLGDLDEVMALCRLDERLIPAVDFGHLHARGLGAINGRADYERVIRAMIDGKGYERAKTMHVHFSKIEFTKAGEKKHRIFADEGFGPEFEPLAEVILEYKLEPRIICESKGTMAEDAKYMLDCYQRLAAR